MRTSQDAYDEALELCRRLRIDGGVRLEMLADPERAAAVLHHAMSRDRVRNVAGYAVANWRTGFDPRPPGETPEPEPGPPALASLEHLWSLEPTSVTVALETAYARAIERAGGFRFVPR